MPDRDHTPEQQVLHGHQHPALYAHGHVQNHALPHAHMSSLPHHNFHNVHVRVNREGDAQNEAQTEVGEMHLHYANPHSHHLLHHDDNGLGNQIEDEAGDGCLEEADIHSDGGHQVDPHSNLPMRANQLSLSYQGEMYLFDTVPPEKVQAVLLLLGGQEVPVGVPMQSHYEQKTSSELPQRLNLPQRLESLSRFRRKRKERNFEKKIRYTVRKEVALRMRREKGQFAPSKPTEEDMASLSNAENAEFCVMGQQQAICLHCGVAEHSTPMMRRGPDGPRTLCNACGLMWANKGVLRELTKGSTTLGTVQHLQPFTGEQKQIADNVVATNGLSNGGAAG